MEKVNFYYIKRSENLFPNNTFKGVILKGKKLQQYRSNPFELADPQQYYCPIENVQGNKVFLYGIGWFKTNIVDIPVYDGTIDGFDTYVKKYGYESMFYSLTGHSLFSQNCCAQTMEKEFMSFIRSRWSPQKYSKFVETYRRINEIQTQVLKENGLADYEITDYLFRPKYNEMMCITTPHCDCIQDDNKVETLYRRKRRIEEKGTNAYDICDILFKEIEEGMKFPISTKDRINFFYGEECTKLYEQILVGFKSLAA